MSQPPGLTMARRPSPRLRPLAVPVLLLVVASVLFLPASAGSATADLAPVGTIEHTLGTVRVGSGPKESYGSPAVGDITGDSAPEIVVGHLDGVVQAYRASTRQRLWSRSLGATAIHASPTIADLDRDGKPDVVVATMDGRVVWLDGPTGVVRRTFRQGAPLHCPAGRDCRPDGFFASPTVADINGDGIPDIVAPSYDHTVYAWSRGGTLLWRRYLEDTLWSSPVVADIDRDGRPEIILGGDIWAGSPLGVPQGGLVWVLRRDGSTYPGYPRSLPGQTVWSSPAVADLDGDRWPDIVVGTGANFTGTGGHRVHAFTARTRASLRGWPVVVDGNVMASPAIGDVDGDGALEVAVAGDKGWVYAFEANGTRRWRACGARGACGSGTTKAGVVIADLDADGVGEVVGTLESSLKVFDGRTGALEWQHAFESGTLTSGSSPAITEVDGRAVIVQSTLRRTSGSNWWAGAGDRSRIHLFRSPTGLCRADWPQFRRDGLRSGRWRGGHDGWLPFTCPSDFVGQQYRDFLGREADGAGTAYWTARLHAGTAGSVVIRSFMGSSEFANAVAPVMRAVLAVTGTHPTDGTTLREAVAAHRAGRPLAEIAESFAQRPAVAARTDAQFVDDVHRHVYKRAASSAELSAGTEALAAGTTRGRYATDRSETEVGRARLGAEVNVAMTYLGMLGRAPDSGGWRYWVAKVRTSSTEALVTGFQRSSEYARRTGG